MTLLFMKQSIKSIQGRNFRELSSGDWARVPTLGRNAHQQSSAGLYAAESTLGCFFEHLGLTSLLPDLDVNELDVWFPWSSRHSECILSSGSLLSKVLNALASQIPPQKQVRGTFGVILPTFASDVGSR